MTTTILNAGTDAYVLSSKPSTALGGPERLAIDSGQAVPFLQFPLGSRIPANATITAARLRVYQVGDWSGETTLVARRVGAWKSSRLTYGNQPGVLGVNHNVTQSNTDSGAAWTFTVTDDVQAWISGGGNYGWRITSTSTARRYIRGFDASSRKPVLEIDWTAPPAAPTDLKPSSGAVSVTKPVLTFSAAEVVAVQVQIDPTGLFTSPTFDSGQVATTEAQFDLGTSTYGGITSGSTMWRVRVWNSSGVSAWSKVATFSYAALPALVITNPGAATADSTPPVTWTFTGQTQRQVITRDAAGNVIDNSGWATTTEQVYTPSKGVTRSGQVASVEVRVRDAVDREATPDAPDYATVTQVYTFTFSDTPAPVSGLVVRQGVSPFPTVRWARGEVADAWAIVRDGEIIATLEDVEPLVSTGVYEYKDWTATPNRDLVYFVAPIVNGETGANGPQFTFTPTSLGLWIADPATGDEVVIWGDDPGDWDRPEDATVYTPVGAAYAIRRVTSRRSVEGSLSGVLIDVADHPTALECEALLEEFGDRSATSTFRMVAGPKNLKVILGDVNLTPSPLDTAEDPLIPVSWSFWSAP